jgi:hypothetical protein
MRQAMFTANQFQSIYKEFIESGLTIRDFCVNHHMRESKFYYWHNKLKGQLPPKRGFIPVVFDHGSKTQASQIPVPVQYQSKTIADPEEVKNTLSCEINYPNGVCLKLNGLTDPEMLHSLLLLNHQ